VDVWSLSTHALGVASMTSYGSTLWWRSLDCGFQSATLNTIHFVRWPQLWLSGSVHSSLLGIPLYTHLVPNRISWSCASHTYVTWLAKSSFKLFELCEKSLFRTDLRLPTKLIRWNTHVGAAALIASSIQWCICAAQLQLQEPLFVCWPFEF